MQTVTSSTQNAPSTLHPLFAAIIAAHFTPLTAPRVQVVGAECIHCGCPDQTDAPCEGCAALDEMADRYAASQQEAF